MIAIRRRTRPLHVTHSRVCDVLAGQDRAAANDLWVRHAVVSGDRFTSWLAGRCSAQGKLAVAYGESLREAGCRGKHGRQKKQGFYHLVNRPRCLLQSQQQQRQSIIRFSVLTIYELTLQKLLVAQSGQR